MKIKLKLSELTEEQKCKVIVSDVRQIRSLKKQLKTKSYLENISISSSAVKSNIYGESLLCGYILGGKHHGE